MKRIFILLIFIAACTFSNAQKINGQWRGYFDSKGDIGLFTGGNTEYVLEIEIDGSDVTGSSYTYFENRKYYVICSLSGTYNKKDKKITVTETARVKGSTPKDWSDCLQTHILYYQKEEGKELLVGNWKTAPGQLSDCGVGFTTLSRRVLSNTNVTFNKNSRTPVTKPNTEVKIPDLTDKNKNNTPPVVKTTPVKPKPIITPPVIKNDSPKKTETPPTVTAPVIKKETELKIDDQSSFEKRNNTVIKTIEIDKETFKVDLYDNGDIDGDSISLFFNGRLLLSHKRLGDKALSLTLTIDDNRSVNELVMYAENLGEIPPNTALMVVTDGDNRYEVRIASDLQKSGTIRFVHKPKNGQ